MGNKPILSVELRILSTYGAKSLRNLGVNKMGWLEKFLEETIAVNAYLLWEKYLRRENHGKNSEEESDGSIL